MAITEVPGATVITGEHIQVFRLLALRRGLMLEIKGIGLRVSAYKTIKREFGCHGTKVSVLAQFEQILQDRGMELRP